MKRVLVVTAVLVAAVAVLVLLTLPPARLTLPAGGDGTVAGILHVHTNRSDGRGTPDEVAAAAARAGLAFLVFTDHGDATRPPDPPVYRSGVLCVDGVEISTTGGHYVALGLPAAPYPLAGEPRDVVDDVRRLGGFGIVAHPDSPKPSLAWRDWTAPFDGMEVINLDSTWRARARWTGWRARLHIGEALVDYPFRSPETIARLVPGTDAIYHWVAQARRRRVVLTAGADAHAKLALMRGDDPGSNRYSLPFPGYEPTFEAMSVHVRLESAFTGDAAADAAALLGAIRRGHLYVSLDGIARPASFSFAATNALGTVHEGDELGLAGPVTLHVTSNAPAGFTTTVWAGTREIARRQAQRFDVIASADPEVYWVDIRSGGREPALWLVSNPVYVRAPDEPARPEPATPVVSRPIFDGRTTSAFTIEHNDTSIGALDLAPLVGGAALRVRYGLASGPQAGQYVALAYDTPNGIAGADALSFTIRAEHPMRISVQLRTRGEGGGGRWQRSVYVDTFEQPRTVSFADTTPIGAAQPAHPDPSTIRSVLFVVDTTNTKPGASGRIWIRNVELGMKN